MEKLLKWLSFSLSALMLSAPLPSHAAYWSPHVGMDYKYWGLVAAPAYYESFPRMNNAFDVYFGTRINGFFGVDFGYENSENKRKTEVYEGGDLIFAQPEEANNSTMIDIRLRSMYGAMNFYWEVVCALELMFMMGAAYVYPDTHIMHLNASDAPIGTWIEYRNRSIPFWSGRFGFAVQYNPLPCIGLKASVLFDQTLRIVYSGFDEDDVGFNVRPYKKATSFGLGFVYSLSNPRRHRPEGECCGC